MVLAASVSVFGDIFSNATGTVEGLKNMFLLYDVSWDDQRWCYRCFLFYSTFVTAGFLTLGCCRIRLSKNQFYVEKYTFCLYFFTGFLNNTSHHRWIFLLLWFHMPVPTYLRVWKVAQKHRISYATRDAVVVRYCQL